MHGRTLRALGGLLIFLWGGPISARTSNDILQWHTGTFPNSQKLNLVPGVGNPSTNSAARAKLQGIAKLFDLAIPTSSETLAEMPAKISDGECIAHDPRDDRFVSRNHTLYLEPDPAQPKSVFVFGRTGNEKVRPDGLSAVDREGNFKFRNASEIASAQVRRTTDSRHNPLLVTIAKTPSGVVQYCKYLLPH